MRLLREKRRWDPNARRPNCRGKGISTCRVMPGKMNLCSWQVTAGKGAVRLQDCSRNCGFYACIVRKRCNLLSSVVIHRLMCPGIRDADLIWIPHREFQGRPRDSPRPFNLWTWNKERRIRSSMPPFFFHKPAIREFFLVLGGGFSFCGRFRCFKSKNPSSRNRKNSATARPFSFLTRGRNPWYSNDNPLFYVNSITDPFH